MHRIHVTDFNSLAGFNVSRVGHHSNLVCAIARSISALISPPIRNASPVTYSETSRIMTAPSILTQSRVEEAVANAGCSESDQFFRLHTL